MRKMLPLLFAYALLVTLVAADAAEFIDGVEPGTTLSYGVHELKWEADENGNRLMDVGEVQVKREGEWASLNQEEFTQTVSRRRGLMYTENAYTYKKTPTRDLNLYVDFPADWKPSDRRPAILWFFGGAWNTGNPYHFKPQAVYFAQRGVVGINVDYRIRTVDGIVTDGYVSGQDAKTAVRWVRKNAAQLGIDPDRIMAGGGSAGGHLAIATQIPSLNDPDDDVSISATVSALLMHNPYVVRINEKSWVYQIDFKTLPPVWVGYSTKDDGAYTDDPSTKRTERSGESFVKELAEAGIPLRTYIKDEGGHGFCSGPPHLQASTADIDEFLQECGLLDAGEAELPDRISGDGMFNQHLKKVAVGEVDRVLPKTLEFVGR